MKNDVLEKLEKLAEKISKAGVNISKDNINKDYIIGNGYADSIVVRSDSGYEAIYIGNIEGDSTDGYMCLYTSNTSTRNSFPKKDVLVKLLTKVLNKEPLEEGEGKASYHDWDRYGKLEKQLDYFSHVVSSISGIK